MSLAGIIRARFGGEIYQRIKNIHKLKLNKKANNPMELFVLQHRNYWIKRYLFGYRNTKNHDFHKSYKILCDSFTDKENLERFKLKDIYIPRKYDKNEANSLVLEIADFLSYYLLTDNPRLFQCCNAITCEGPYEYENVNISKGDVVIDAGANFGLFAAMASAKGAEAIYAFEPNYKILKEYLSKTAKWNKHIHVCEYALSDKKEGLRFLIDKDSARSSLEIIGRDLNSTKIKTTVQAISLDEFVRENNIPRVDFIKADIEGAERLMLMGAKQVLRDFAPKLAICTYHLPDDPKVLRELILDANPNYVIEEKFMKMYAHVPGR